MTISRSPSRLRSRPFALLFISLLLITAASASSGDKHPKFKQCVEACTSTARASPLSLPLRLTRWSADADCKYECMHRLTDAAELAVREGRWNGGRVVHQFFGKWPFYRFLGMQEPFSVLFSLGNLLAHRRGLLSLRSVLAASPLRQLCALWAWVNMNAWLWSSVFHTRDLPWTEKADYFSAGATVLYSFYLVVIRVLAPPARARAPLALACALAFVAHVTYLSRGRFDYGYNMAANIAIGMIHNALWIYHAVHHLRRNAALRRWPLSSAQPPPHPAPAQPIAIVVLTTAAMLLEVFDFPAWRRMIDAHALWHAATIPIIWLWYGFLRKDVEWEERWIEVERRVGGEAGGRLKD